MPFKKRWLISALLAGGVVIYSWSRRHGLRRMVHNPRFFSGPRATMYAAVATPIFGGFYQRVARDLAERAPGAQVLDIGSGPGRLAVTLATFAPTAQITGLDIAPEMIDLANALAAQSGVADRVTFQIGDATALPFPDASFDAVVSTLSLHHWANPAAGLAEIYRVLRPGGLARIYDLPDWATQFERTGPGLAGLARESPFGEHGAFATEVATRLGPIPMICRLELRRAE